jgi:hypothetical protein
VLVLARVHKKQIEARLASLAEKIFWILEAKVSPGRGLAKSSPWIGLFSEAASRPGYPLAPMFLVHDPL